VLQDHHEPSESDAPGIDNAVPEVTPSAFVVDKVDKRDTGHAGDGEADEEQHEPDGAVEPQTQSDGRQPEEPRSSYRDGEIHPPTSDTIGCILDIAL